MSETLRRLREYCGKLPSQAEAAAERCIQVSFVGSGYFGKAVSMEPSGRQLIWQQTFWH